MEPFIGQLMCFGGNFPPRGWANCDGQLLAISSNTALFSILGTMYGGDGRTTFGLPDLKGRSPIHVGQGAGLPSYSQGTKAGTPTNTLVTGQLPSHTHGYTQLNGTVKVSNSDGINGNPKNKIIGRTGGGTGTLDYLVDGTPANTLQPNILAFTGTLDNTGSNQSINNLSPFQVIRWCIALVGLYPSRS